MSRVSHEERRAIGSDRDGGIEFNFAICPRCCFVYMSPRMTDEAAEDYYADEFHQHKAWGTLQLGRITGALLAPFKDRLQRRSHDLLAEKQVRSFESLRNELFAREDLGPQSIVVDVGCAWGVLARRIHEEFGCEVYGVEPSRAAADYARAQGVEIIASTAETMGEVASLQGRVDLAIFHTSLRNVNDIEATMEQTRKLLKPTGRIYIKTGNYIWNNRLVRFNNYAFMPENLKYFLERNGFKVLWMNAAPHPSETRGYDKAHRFMSVCARRDDTVVATLPDLNCDRIIAEARAGKERSLAEAVA